MMTARTELEITWDGPVKGLAENRVSLGEFGAALGLLVSAARRIASNAITNALEPAEVGRLASAAKNLDIEISGVKQNSSGFSTVLTFDAPGSLQTPLFNQFTENVGLELLRSIRSESEGTFRNALVRNYLRALPKQLTRQAYNLHENGRAIERVEIGSVRLAEMPDDVPSLREIEGHVAGVVFEPGKQEVRLKGNTNTVAFDATEEQVERALAIRRDDVRVLGVHDGKRGRMLRIEAADQTRFTVTPEAIEQHIFMRWDGVFARLAK